MTLRAATIIIALLLIAVIAFLLFNFLSAFFRNEKIITITKEATFDPTELRVDNGQVVKVKNQDANDHEVITKDTNKTLVTVKSGKTSDKLELENDNNYDLTLVENNQARTKIIVGSPAQSDSTPSADLSTVTTPTPTPTPSPTPTPTSSTTTRIATSSASGRPLPNTGAAEDMAALLLLIIGGSLLTKYSKPFIS